MQEIDIPRYQDSQGQIFFWEIDEFVVSVGLFGIGIVADMMTTSFVMIYFVSAALRKIKSLSLEGSLMHLVYWWGIAPLNKMPFDGSRREKWV